jgi:uncharacterized protein YjdB
MLEDWMKPKNRAAVSFAFALATTLGACAGNDPSAPSDALHQSPSSQPVGSNSATQLITVPGSLALFAGSTATVTAARVDASGTIVEVLSGSLPWTSSNTAVATVNNTGVVTGVASGEATLSVNVDGQSASVRVLVMK